MTSVQPDSVQPDSVQPGSPAELRRVAAPTRRSARDMALSVAVLLVPVLLLVGLYEFLYNGDHPRAIDPAGSYAAARHSARFPVREPAGLPGGWAVISSGYGAQSGGSTLRVGYITPGGNGAQLIESDRPVNELLPAELGADAQPGNLVDIAGRQWRAYPVARDGNQALVLAEGAGTTIVIGTAPDGDLRTLAAALQ